MTQLASIILAAGKGTRMNSDLPKVAHSVARGPMVSWVADACAESGCSRIVIVVGHHQEVVREIFADWPGDAPPVEFAVQQPQFGFRCATPYGVCLMAQGGPLGMACYCPTSYGAVPGQIYP